MITTSHSSLTLHLEHQVNGWLVHARADDGTPATERIRAGLNLWQTDPALTERIDAQAAAMRRDSPPQASGRVKLRITLDAAIRRQLVDARAADRIPTAVRVRAVVQLWHDDPKIRELIDTKAAELRHQRRAATLQTAG